MQNLSLKDQPVREPDLSGGADFFRHGLTGKIGFGGDDLDTNQMEGPQAERDKRSSGRRGGALFRLRGADPIIKVALTIPGLNPVDAAPSYQIPVARVGN